MSSIPYRYEHAISYDKDGLKFTIKENLVDGEKGFTIMFLTKMGEKFYKIYAKETSSGEFDCKVKEGEKESDEKMDTAKLVKSLKSHDASDAMIEYITKGRSKKSKKIKGGAKKGSKKSSKKGSKKSSKKGSKKSSKKGSKKMSGGAKKRGSKKSSKKGSRKSKK